MRAVGEPVDYPGRAAALGALIAAEAPAAEAAGRLTEPVVTALVEAGLLRLLLPADERFRHFSDEARVVVSEPLIDLPGPWHEVAPSTALVVRDGPDSEDLPFVPCLP